MQALNRGQVWVFDFLAKAASPGAEKAQEGPIANPAGFVARRSKMFMTTDGNRPNFKRLQAGRSSRRDHRGSRTRRRVPLDSIYPT